MRPAVRGVQPVDDDCVVVPAFLRHPLLPVGRAQATVSLRLRESSIDQSNGSM
jgi:hypothetical protein